MTAYKGFTLNTPATPAPWGATEYQAWQDIIDTCVKGTIAVASDTTNGHQHTSLNKTATTKIIQVNTSSGYVGIGSSVTAPVGIVQAVYDTTTNSQAGLCLNIGQATASSGTFVRDTTNPIARLRDCGTLTDDGVLDVVYTAGLNKKLIVYGDFWACDASGYYCRIRASDTLGVWFIEWNSTDIWVSTDTDTKYCLLWTNKIGGNSSKLQFKNRLGSTKRIAYDLLVMVDE